VIRSLDQADASSDPAQEPPAEGVEVETEESSDSANLVALDPDVTFDAAAVAALGTGEAKAIGVPGPAITHWPSSAGVVGARGSCIDPRGFTLDTLEMNGPEPPFETRSCAVSATNPEPEDIRRRQYTSQDRAHLTRFEDP
jgi:hypothetical protein